MPGVDADALYDKGSFEMDQRLGDGPPIIEPDFISQNGEASLTADERHAWLRARAAEAKEKGCVHGRYSIHPTLPHLVLFEGWKVRPEAEGEQRWQLTAA